MPNVINSNSISRLKSDVFSSVKHNLRTFFAVNGANEL